MGRVPPPVTPATQGRQRRFTHRKNWKGVSGHGNHEKRHGPGHPAGAAEAAGKSPGFRH
nr:MAG TPA: hypothetical protein [Bacteriophage sp.]